MTSEATKIDDGGAEPKLGPELHALGMSLRDHFAGMAMAAMMSSYRKVDRDPRRRRDTDSLLDFMEPDVEGIYAEGTSDNGGLAGAAYHVADLMLAARKVGAQ